MSTTRCKFRCESITHLPGHDKKVKRNVVMNPVYSNDPNSENKKFWDASPGGKFELSYINENIQFEPGGEYYIDITPAPATPTV